MEKIVEEFSAEMVDGKPVFKCRTEITKHPDGRQDVNVHAPDPQLMKKFIDEQASKVIISNNQ